jgi:xylulokinase
MTPVSTSDLLVGIDVGTTALKAIAIDPSGAVQARSEIPYPFNQIAPGWTEQDPDDWARAARDALAELGIARPAAIGLSGQMHGLVVLDRQDRVVRPAILWNDQRTTEQVARIESTIGRDRLIELTGNRALTGFTAPKLLWLRGNDAEAYRRTARIMLPKDYVRLALTGEHATDVADASGTLLFDVAHRRWSRPMLDALDIDPSLLPPALESPEISGETREGTPVAAGAGDQAAGAIGVGIHDAGPLSVVLGTSGVVFAARSDYGHDRAGAVHAFCHAAPDRWHVMGVMLSAAGALRWLHDTIAPDVSYDVLLSEAATVPPGARGLTFLPYLSGERTPYADADVRGLFHGLGLEHSRSDLVRAVLEGVALGLRDCLEALRSTGVSPTQARASGGGARNSLWLQIVASTLGIPVERPAIEEGAAYGAALLGGVANGTWSSVAEACDATIAIRETIDPDPEWQVIYGERHVRFASLYAAARPQG